MNYYPMHVGDYTAHTAHLTWEEDIAYRRMLDWYYLNEKALPTDPVKVARLVRMPQSLAVIEAVLSEFFIPSNDGWHNKRADAELTSMLSKQEQQNSKDAHEADRMRRYRERRAEMFASLRVAGVVPAWDISMMELQRLHEENCNAHATEPETHLQREQVQNCNAHATEPETHLQREQVQNCNAPATAIPTPTPTPTPIEKEPNGSLLAAKRRKQLPADFMPSNAGMQFAVERGLNVGEELQKFSDYHRAKGSVMLDWQAAWRTWASNAKTFARGSPVANKQVAIEQRNKAAADEWLAAEGFAA